MLGSIIWFKKNIGKPSSLFKRRLNTPQGWAETFLGGIYHIQGEEDKATQMLNGLLSQKKDQFVSSFCIAGLYNFLDEKDKTFEWLEKAYQERDILMPLLDVLKIFDNLRDDSRFKALKKKMGFDKWLGKQYRLMNSP